MCVKITAKIALQNIVSEAKFVFEFDCFSREKFSVTFWNKRYDLTEKPSDF